MSAPSLGVSTVCCPQLGARDLAEAVLAHGGDSVELRIGKGHAWESEGATVVAAAGLTVTTIASGRTLGADAETGGCEDIDTATAVGAALRCFLDSRWERDEQTRSRAREQAAALQRALGADAAVVVEPHPGYAAVGAVAAFCAETGSRAVLDTFATHRFGADVHEALAQLGAALRVLHLKGFVPAPGGGWRHRPLEQDDLPSGSELACAPGLVSVVVETKAGSQWRDLRLLRHWAERELLPPARGARA